MAQDNSTTTGYNPNLSYFAQRDADSLKGDKGDKGDQGEPGVNGTDGKNGEPGESFNQPNNFITFDGRLSQLFLASAEGSLPDNTIYAIQSEENNEFYLQSFGFLYQINATKVNTSPYKPTVAPDSKKPE